MILCADEIKIIFWGGNSEQFVLALILIND